MKSRSSDSPISRILRPLGGLLGFSFGHLSTLKAHASCRPMNNPFSHYPQVAQRKKCFQLGRVFDKTPKASPAIAKLAFDHPEGAFHFGPNAGLIGINLLVKRLMADWQLASNLLRTPLQAQQIGGLLENSGGHSRGLSALLRSLVRQLTGLLGPVILKASVALKLSACGRFVSIQQLGNLSLIVSGFHKVVNLISLRLTEMFVVYGQLRMVGQEALNTKHSQPYSPQSNKVALRAWIHQNEYRTI